MRRVIVVFGVAVLLAVPTAAFALTRTLHGPAGTSPNASVDIAFHYRHTHARVITRFELNNIPITCAGGRFSAVSYKFAHRIHVSSANKFHATESVGAATYKVKGRFHGVHKATGTLRVTGTVPACSSGDTGIVNWSATPAARGQ